MYGIYPRSWGYEVSIVRNGTRYFKQFGRASYGGDQQALRQAQDWRDGVVRSVPPVPRRDRAEKLRINNTTGVSGVFCQVAPGGKVRAWVAKTYIGQDEILRTDFPVNTMGEAAQTLAIEERARQLDRMDGLAKLHPAEEAIRTSPPAFAPEQLSNKRSKSEIKRSTNSSGVSGVHFKAPNPGHPGYWLAITYTAGKGSVSKAFSIKEHGAEKAKLLAIEERERQLEQKLVHMQQAAAGALSIPYLQEPRQGARPHGLAAGARPQQ
ncbi:AP2 domain-containing protein [Variovorax gossypii]|uniref:AP2 domain-containing protein n=2 Tax=Comamonadaceae TaxID=80864 RepID=A0A3S0GUR7_9BURK|nr:AP2 domain-containing protein [Variovorax gossypii]